MVFPQKTLPALVLLALGAACAGPEPADDEVPMQRTQVEAAAVVGAAPMAGAAPMEWGAEPLTLASALQWIRERNPQVALGWAHLRQAEAAVAQGRAAFLPQLQLEAGYLRADAPSAFLFKTIDARSYVPGTDFNDPGTFDNFELGVGMGWNLYAGGRHRQGLEMARIGRLQAEVGLTQVHHQLQAAALDLWFSARIAFEQQRIADSAIDLLHAQLAEAQHRFEEGTLLKADLLSLKVRSAEAQEHALRAQHGVKMARLGLAALLDVAEPELPTLALGTEEGDPSRLPADLPTALAAAFQSRPELEQMRLQLAQGELRVEQAGASRRPSLDLIARTWADDDALNFSDSEANWSLGLLASWPIFDGGQTGAKKAAAVAQLSALRAQERALLNRVRQEVEGAYLRSIEASAREQVAASASELALESLRLVQLQHEAGAATVTRYLEAQQMATAAQMRQVQARFDRRRALAELSLAMGFPQ